MSIDVGSERYAGVKRQQVTDFGIGSNSLGSDLCVEKAEGYQARTAVGETPPP